LLAGVTVVFFGQKIRVEDFEAAAMPYMNELYRTATRLTGDRTEAEDLVQDVYVAAWKSFHRFELGTNCRAWLYKILFNKYEHYWRKKAKLRLVDDVDETLEQNIPYVAPIPEHLTDEEILTAFQGIPEKYREVVLLADVQEFAYKEVSNILNVPIGTVMSRLSRGRAMLRDKLSGIAESYGFKSAANGGQRS
jgi:RNA polymerase sigma-70 factor (ECF subfamily)